MEILLSNITMIDSLIIAFALVAIVFWAFSFLRSRAIAKQIDEWKRTKDISVSHVLYRDLAVAYNVFLTIISLFPLLGMFGTVWGLLSVDLSGNMDAVKGNFFIALTSTAWGIIFSIGFKFFNSFFAVGIETQIEEARKLEEITGPHRKKKSR